MKFALFFGLIAFSAVSLSAQNSIPAEADWSSEIYQVDKKYPGYIISLEGDTTYGFLKAHARCATGGVGASNQTRAEFYLKESDRKPVDKFKAKELKGYKIADKVYESINYSGGLLNKPNFNLVIKEGAIRQYEWYSTVENFHAIHRQSGEDEKTFNDRRYETDLIIAKDPEEPIDYSMLGLRFSKKMPEMITDHEELAKKVANKEPGYTFLQMFEIIDEYNAWAAQKEAE